MSPDEGRHGTNLGEGFDASSTAKPRPCRGRFWSRLYKKGALRVQRPEGHASVSLALLSTLVDVPGTAAPVALRRRAREADRELRV